jgi:hypothetical protein
MGDGRINISLPKPLNDRLEAYCVELTQRQGRIIDALRANIARRAIEEWLDAHENDFDFKKLLKKNTKNKG